MDLLLQLTWFFSELIFLKAVRVELRRRQSAKDRPKALQREYAVFLMHFIDDHRGQRLAERHALEHHDTIWVLDRSMNY